MRFNKHQKNLISTLFVSRCPLCGLLVGYLDRRCPQCGYKLYPHCEAVTDCGLLVNYLNSRCQLVTNCHRLEKQRIRRNYEEYQCYNNRKSYICSL